MKNFILAITSFIMTVLFFSQTALAQTEENFGFVPRAPGTIAEGESGNDLIAKPENNSQPQSNNPESRDTTPCEGCIKHNWSHRYMQTYKTVKPAKSGTTTPNSREEKEGKE